MHVPFAIELYRAFLGGKSIADLSVQLGIPEERVEWRLRAAAQYFALRPAAASGRKVVIRIVRRF
jgi:hypothetical protein